ncbi:hypothetical protein [Salinisphaera sp. G21_0]|uniref:hypothetical protein n=1 Tax=Salinisphaera sp. G21_0 TaxID=2821094 RepID=UPI001ADC4826|nr:hypothetical protein [Salinisphaera sp. G21_0]MBO9481585.1 hypothetical protein [Salinisphaera sp. G21_0]
MEIPTYSTQLIAASDDFSNYHDTTFSEFGLSGQVFSREVVKAANILCAMHTDKTRKYLQQPMEPVHFLTDTPRLEKRSIVIITSHTKEDQSPAGNKLDITTSASEPGQSQTIFQGKTCQKAYARSEKRKAYLKAYASTEKRKAYQKAYQKAYAKTAKRKAYLKAYQKAYAQSEKGKAYRKAYSKSEKQKAYQKAYRESEKGKASREAYARSEKRKAYLEAYCKSEKHKAYNKAYSQTEKRKASIRAWAQSEKGKAYHKAYRQSEQRKAYQRAYYKAFKNTGDREQARIAGKQASTLIRE